MGWCLADSEEGGHGRVTYLHEFVHCHCPQIEDFLQVLLHIHQQVTNKIECPTVCSEICVRARRVRGRAQSALAQRRVRLCHNDECRYNTTTSAAMAQQMSVLE